MRFRRPPAWVVIVGMILFLAAVAIAVSLIPTGYVAIEPHQPVDLAGALTVDGRQPEPIHGRLLLVGVEVRPVNLLQKWLLGLDPKVTLETDPNAGDTQAQARDDAAIVDSKRIAAAVAFRLLGQPPRLSGDGAMVSGVDPSGPANGLLQPADQILEVDGKPIVTSFDLIEMVARMSPGTKVTLGVRRDRRPLLVTLHTIAAPPGDSLHRSRIGVQVNTPNLQITLPHQVTIRTPNVSGPSAGLSFALDIYDSESPADILRGRYVVATGAITLEGQVLPVGGIRQKAISAQDDGAEMMIVPQANVPEAVAAVKQFCRTGQVCMHVLGVDSVQEALRLLSLPSEQLAVKFANP
jgi:PDZ domain-containing protein